MPPHKINQASGHVLLFDLDGTLTDPRAGIVRCMRYALDKLGVSSPSDDVLARPSARRFAERSLPCSRPRT